MAEPVSVSVAVEGILDEAVATRLLEAVGMAVARSYGFEGRGHLLVLASSGARWQHVLITIWPRERSEVMEQQGARILTL